jgi:hypothetical protein
MGWAGHVAYMGKMGHKNVKGRDHLGDLGAYGRIILQCILKTVRQKQVICWHHFMNRRRFFKKQGVRVLTRFNSFMTGPGGWLL